MHSFVDSLRCQRLNDNFSTICSTSTYFHCCIVCGSHATWVHVFRIPWCFLNYFTPRPNVHMHENLSNSFGGTHSRELPHTKLSFTSKKTENISIAQDNLLLLGVSRKSKWKKKEICLPILKIEWNRNQKIQAKKCGKIPTKSNNLLNFAWLLCYAALVRSSWFWILIRFIWQACKPSSLPCKSIFSFLFFSIKSQNTISIIFQSACIDITLGSGPHHRRLRKIVPFQPLFGQQMFDQCGVCIVYISIKWPPLSLSFLKSKFTQVKNEYIKTFPEDWWQHAKKKQTESFSSLLELHA